MNKVYLFLLCLFLFGCLEKEESKINFNKKVKFSAGYIYIPDFSEVKTTEGDILIIPPIGSNYSYVYSIVEKNGSTIRGDLLNAGYEVFDCTDLNFYIDTDGGFIVESDSEYVIANKAGSTYLIDMFIDFDLCNLSELIN